MAKDTLLVSNSDQFIADALKAVKFRFVESASDGNSLTDTTAYHPEFAHQHFGENEQIFGYSELDVNIFYSAASMHSFIDISYKARIDSVNVDVQPDNIVDKIQNQLPQDQLAMLRHSKGEFLTDIADQESFRPFGQLMAKFSVETAASDQDGSSCRTDLEMYKVTETSEAFDRYLVRVQSLALWFIDACQYTDSSDERWIHYFIYKKSKSSEGVDCYCLAAFASVYKFYAYPEHFRPRIAQIMVLPPYRRRGLGAKILQNIYNDLVPCRNVVDITVEDPSDSFIHLRDFVDCINCENLASFTREYLQKGLSEDMKREAKEKLKLGLCQIRRVYEILRLKCTDTGDKTAYRNYRLDVKRRLNIPFKKSQRDWAKIQKALNDEEYTSVAAGNGSGEKRMQELERMFQETLDDYRTTINRLKTFGPSAKLTNSTTQIVNGFH